MNSYQPDSYPFDMPYQPIGMNHNMEFPPNRKRRRFGCCSCGCAFGCLAFVLIIALGIASIVYSVTSGSEPLTVSPETTVITGPLKSDGKTIDFSQAIQEMMKADTQPEQNGFRDVLLGYGRGLFEPDADHDQTYLAMCEELGIDPKTPPTFILPPIEKTAENHDQWLEQVSPGLDAVQAAMTKPRYYIPFQSKDERELALLSHPFDVYEFHGRIADAFWMRSVLRRQSGDWTGFWQDTLAPMRLFRRVTFNQTWLHALAGQDDETALTAASEIAQTLPHWTPEQLEGAINDLESLPPWQDQQTTLKMIQFMLLDVFSFMSSANENGNNDNAEMPSRFPDVSREMERAKKMFQVIAFDWNHLSKALNQEIDNYADRLTQASGKSLEEQFELLQLRQPKESKDQFLERTLNEKNMEEWVMHYFETERLSDLFFASGRSKLFGTVIGGKLVSWTVGEMYRLQIMEESRCQALRYALALERFRRTAGHYPESLDDLGLEPMAADRNLQYETHVEGYRLHNHVFQMDVKLPPQTVR